MHARRFVSTLTLAGLALAACTASPYIDDELYEVALEPTLPDLRTAPLPFQGDELAAPVPKAAAVDVAEPAAPAPAPTPFGDDTAYALDLRGVPVAEAVHLIADKAGVNVYLDAGLDMPVDASFPAITLDQALHVILTRHGLVLIEEPAGVYWVERRDGSQVATQVFRMQSVNAADVTTNLATLVGEEVDLVVDANQNLIIARGPGRDLDFIAEYLEQADRLKSQVLIEVEILEILLDDTFELGVQTALADNDLIGDVFGSVDVDLATGAEEFTAVLGHSTKSISAVVNALSTFGAVNIVSSPRILAVTNTEANIEVVREVPYIDTSTSIQTDAGGGSVTSQETVEFKEVGITLKVTPVVQEGGIVSLVVEQEYSEVVEFFAGIPVVDTRKVNTTFLVQESDTAMIGGLIQDRQSERDRGVPVLMHVPVLGHLFRSDEDEVSRRELIILLRPRLADPAEAARLAQEYHADYVERVEASGLTAERGGPTQR